MIKHWKKLKSEIIFNHPWFRLRKDTVELPNGIILDDYILSERPDVVLIFPITENHEVVMVEQYKHAAENVLLEFPGGFFDNTRESPVDAAKRELLEETGYSCEKIKQIACVCDNPTKDCNNTYLFIAYNCKKTHAQKLDTTEDICVKLCNIDSIEKRILSNEIKATLSVALGLMALKKL